MGFRKIISFGDSSFVVSLPKDWVTKNGLKKGDPVNVEEKDDGIKITPVNRKQSPSTKEINISFDGNVRKLNAELVYAYVENYNLINILGKDLFSYMKQIEQTVDNFVALEVMQKSPTKIVIKDCLNLNEISVYDTLRRIDRIVLSMAEDVKNYFTGKVKNVNESLEYKEKDVTRLSNLLFKILKRSFDPNDKALLNLSLDDIFFYWEVILFVEKVGDQLKRMPRNINAPLPNDFILIFDKVMEQYSEAMNANFNVNYEAAINVIVNKRKIYDEIDNLADKLPARSLGTTTERAKNINSHAGNIAKAFLKLKLEHKK